MPALQRPTYLANRNPSPLAATLVGGLGVAQPPRISLKDDRFTLLMPNGDRHPQVQPALTIDVIVVGGNPTASRIYYDAAYNADDVAAPICWSDNGVGPSVSAGAPQSPTCAECPNAVWGSKISPNGSKVPACSTVKKVAVLVAGAGDTVFLLQIPPASLKLWRNFLAHLETLRASIDEVIVRVSMSDKTLAFEPVDFLPQEVYEFAQKVMASPEIDVVVGMKDKPREGFLPAPAEKPALGFSATPQREAPAQSFTAAPAQAASFAAGAGQATGQTLTGFALPAASNGSAAETDEQRELRELREFKAKMSAGAAASTDALAEKPKRKPKETQVGPGPIPAGTFQPPQSFVGGNGHTPAGFGMAPAQPASSAIEDAIAKAFNLPI